MKSYNFFKIWLISPKSIYTLFKQKKRSNLKKWLADKIVNFKSNVDHSHQILLVQLVEDLHFIIKLSAASKVISEKYNLEVKLYDNKIFFQKKYIYIEYLFNILKINSIYYIFKSFSNEIIFKNSSLYKDQKIIQDTLCKIKDELSIKGLEGLINLKFENIYVGDLITDTYLRFYSKPTIKEINNDIFNIIEIALNIFYNFKYVLQNNNIRVLLTTYTTYIQHGLVVRLCLSKGIDVYCVGYYNFVLQKITINFPYHQINHTLFNEDSKISEINLSKAESVFTSRFNGILDNATSFMKESTYNNSLIDPELKIKFTKNKRNIVVYAHDFFDSPHINRILLFPDFYKYLKFVLDNVNDLIHTSVFIKVHPNGIKGSKEILIDLVNSFNNKNFYILDVNVSNNHIVELNPDIVCTARGTVGFEMAYFGIPTIALYDNVYSNFNFVHTCKTIEEYRLLLRGEILPKIDYNKSSIYKCYFYAFINKLPLKSNNFFELLNNIKYNDNEDEFINSIKRNSLLDKPDDILSIYRDALDIEDKSTFF